MIKQQWQQEPEPLVGLVLVRLLVVLLLALLGQRSEPPLVVLLAALSDGFLVKAKRTQTQRLSAVGWQYRHWSGHPLRQLHIVHLWPNSNIKELNHGNTNINATNR